MAKVNIIINDKMHEVIKRVAFEANISYSEATSRIFAIASVIFSETEGDYIVVSDVKHSLVLRGLR